MKYAFQVGLGAGLQALMKERRLWFCPKYKHRSKSKEDFYDPICEHALYNNNLEIFQLHHKALASWRFSISVSVSERERFNWEELASWNNKT